MAVSGPAFASVPDYPTLRALDLQFVGELVDDGPGDFSVSVGEAFFRFFDVKEALTLLAPQSRRGGQSTWR